MEFVVLGWPPDGPTLRLDYRRFAYAGKFVMSNTGKAVVRDARAESERGNSGGNSEDEGDTDHRSDTDDHSDTDDRFDTDDYDTDVVAALAFNADRTDESVLWYRYITVRSDAKGSQLGPKLAAFVAACAAERGYERVKIAVNNPFAYEAMYKASFAWTGEETGVAELVLERPTSRDDALASRRRPAETYRAGLDCYRDRDLGDPEASFLRERVGSDPPAPCDVPETR